jgi:adenylate cyclase
MRITAQLIDAQSGAHLWADCFDGSLADIFELQDKVASSVAGVIEPALQAAETVDPPAARKPIRPLTTFTCAPTRCCFVHMGNPPRPSNAAFCAGLFR